MILTWIVLLTWSVHIDFDHLFFAFEVDLTASVTGQQGMFTPRHLIPPLVYSEVRVWPTLKFVFPIGLFIIYAILLKNNPSPF
jgi:hypothetical protein